MNMDNAVPILPYAHSENENSSYQVQDLELYKLIDYLTYLAQFPNLRDKNSEYFRLGKLKKATTIDNILPTVFNDTLS